MVMSDIVELYYVTVEMFETEEGRLFASFFLIISPSLVVSDHHMNSFVLPF